MREHEERKVITLYGDREWHDPDPHDSTAESVLRGYRLLNEEINRLAAKVTIHSVSYSSELLPWPKPSQTRHLRLFATLVYSGQLDVHTEFMEAVEVGAKSRRADETVIDVMI